MIDFYTFATPNGKKVKIMLEELGVPYKEHTINLRNMEQKTPEFLAINPNGKIPAIVDNEGPFGKKTTVFESGAILYYLAEKYGKFIGSHLDSKAHTMQWVMFQMSGIGPNFGNLHYGLNSMEVKNPAFIQRFEKESKRLLEVMETQLRKNTYLAGHEYTIADMATYPWMQGFRATREEWFTNLPSVRRWMDAVGSRPPVQKALA
ncbi:glutathione S-transferase family protein [Bdellovibrio sp. HCB2-146]|uniref:glutathione S-transferase family protein n=1 Tax=Bdellovibrio sp. HCB2-146 TaxID=3394362 RepID=UPI0039BC59AC